MYSICRGHSFGFVYAVTKLCVRLFLLFGCTSIAAMMYIVGWILLYFQALFKDVDALCKVCVGATRGTRRSAHHHVIRALVHVVLTASRSTQDEYDLRVPITLLPALTASFLSFFLVRLSSRALEQYLARDSRTLPPFHPILALLLCTYSSTIHSSLLATAEVAAARSSARACIQDCYPARRRGHHHHRVNLEFFLSLSLFFTSVLLSPLGDRPVGPLSTRSRHFHTRANFTSFSN